MENILKVLGVISGGVIGLLGGWDMLLQGIVIFMIIDYFSGVLSAGVNKELNSKIGFKGIAKKIMILLLIAVATYLDNYLNIAFGTNAVIRDAVISFYIVNELISIVENARKIGLTVPEIFTNIANFIKEKISNNKG